MSDKTVQSTTGWKRILVFMVHAGQVCPDKPTDPTVEICQTRANLMFEEVLETIEKGLRFKMVDRHTRRAIKAEDIVLEPMDSAQGWPGPDMVEIIDGCQVVRVVTTGTEIACGVRDLEIQEAVDENNLTKFRHVCPDCGYDQTTEHRGAAILRAGEEFKTGPGQTICYECGFQYRSGYRRDDGKWVKPENHQPPDIAGLIQRQTDAAEEEE